MLPHFVRIHGLHRLAKSFVRRFRVCISCIYTSCIGVWSTSDRVSVLLHFVHIHELHWPQIRSPLHIFFLHFVRIHGLHLNADRQVPRFRTAFRVYTRVASADMPYFMQLSLLPLCNIIYIHDCQSNIYSVIHN